MIKRLCIAILAWGAAVSAGATALRFTNVTLQAGITHLFERPQGSLLSTSGTAQELKAMYGGAVAEDFNGDGWMDLYVLQCGANSNLLYMNKGDGTFTNEATLRGVDFATNSAGVCAGDYDNDGDVDLAVTRFIWTPYLLTNDGAGFFGKVELVGPTNLDVADWQRFTSPSWGDMNNDGQLELVHGQWFGTGRQSLFFYTNGNGVLDYTIPWDLSTVENDYVFSPVFVDLNGDRRQDLVSISDYGNTRLYLNTGSNSFVVATSGSGVGSDSNGMGCAAADFDDDGDLDLFVTSVMDTNPPPYGRWGLDGNRLYVNDGKATFVDGTSLAGVRNGNWGWGTAAGDLDNDGVTDLYMVNGTYHLQYSAMTSMLYRFNFHPARLFQGVGGGSFTNVAEYAGAADYGQGRATLLFDFDRDGDLDIFIANNQVLTVVGTNTVMTPGPPTLLRNDTPATNKWLDVKLAGTPPFHRHGIGSRAYITVGGRRQMRELNASTGYLGHGPNRIAHFGLGTNSTVAEVRAEWVSGAAVVIENVAPNQTVELPSPLAAISSTRVHAGVAVTANAAALGATPRSWVIEGQTNTDPVVRAFYHPGIHELRLNIYATNGTTLLRSELHRVTVDSTVVSSVSPLSNNLWQIQWDAISGGVYRVQATPTFPAGTWVNVSGLSTAPAAGPQARIVTNATPNPVWRVLEFVP